MTEPREYRLKRLKMRSMRRGIKEMDIILTAYADASLDGLSPEALDLYDGLLDENDQDLYQWVTGQVAPPTRFATLITDVSQVFQK